MLILGVLFSSCTWLLSHIRTDTVTVLTSGAMFMELTVSSLLGNLDDYHRYPDHDCSVTINMIIVIVIDIATTIYMYLILMNKKESRTKDSQKNYKN